MGWPHGMAYLFVILKLSDHTDISWLWLLLFVWLAYYFGPNVNPDPEDEE
jgi:uncharacterized membrane protein